MMYVQLRTGRAALTKGNSMISGKNYAGCSFIFNRWIAALRLCKNKRGIKVLNRSRREAGRMKPDGMEMLSPDRKTRRMV